MKEQHCSAEVLDRQVSNHFYLQVRYIANTLCSREFSFPEFEVFDLQPSLAIREFTFTNGKRAQAPVGRGCAAPECRPPLPERFSASGSAEVASSSSDPAGRLRVESRCWPGCRSCARRRRRCSAWKRLCTTSWTGSRWPRAPHFSFSCSRALGRRTLRGAPAPAAPACCPFSFSSPGRRAQTWWRRQAPRGAGFEIMGPPL